MTRGNSINFDGTINSVRIFDRALSAEGIQEIYNSKGPFGFLADGWYSIAIVVSGKGKRNTYINGDKTDR